MKKIILGLALLVSISTVASECKMSIQNEVDGLELAKVKKSLKKKGFSLVESISEADMQLKLEAYCSDGTAGLGCHRVYGFITVSSLESNESVYLKKITDSSIFGNANKQAAVDSDIVKIPKCSDIVL